MPKFDYKKEYKEFYLPKTTPAIVNVPTMQYIMIDGKGNPNDAKGEYAQALELLYPLCYTISMSYKGSYAIAGFFEYTVPPLEGLWDVDDGGLHDSRNKNRFVWTSMIRQPDFVTSEVFAWACETVKRKKAGLNMDIARLEKLDEGTCVQCMHIGPYDDEPATIEKMCEYARKQGYELQYTNTRKHHEIYLGDPRKTAAEKLKTVIRLPCVRLIHQ